MRRRRRKASGRHHLAALTLLFLTACASNPPDSAQHRATTPAAEAPRPAPAVLQEAARPVVVPPPVNSDPAQFIGLDAVALAGLLGEPVRVRRDGSSEIRQFRAGNACQLDAFMYADVAQTRVVHVELRRGLDRLEGSAAQECMRRLLTPPATS